jgi:CheY-like chemotaxis protein
LNLLIVDDDPDVVWVIGRRLVKEGYSVSTATSATEAMRIMRSEDVDILITDVQMPGMSGLELIVWARSNRPHVRVVVITAYGTPALRRAVTSKGALVCLEKPVDPEDLIAWLSAKGKNGMVGRVAEVELFDYMQLLSMANRSRVVEINLGDSTGRIYVRKGRVVHAEVGEVQGLPAFYECVTSERGRFQDMQFQEPAVVSIDAPLDSLLLEAAHVLDERARTDNGVASGGEGNDE